METQNDLCTHCQRVTPHIVRDYYDRTELHCCQCNQITDVVWNEEDELWEAN